MGQTSIRVGTVNIARKIGPDAWRECWEDTAARADLFVVNECGSAAQRAVYIDEARNHGFSHFGLSLGPNPVFHDTDVWTVGAAKQYRLHGAAIGHLARLWPGFNGPRYATLTVNHHEVAAGLPPVVFIGTHLVPRGRKVTARFRARARRKSVARLRELVKAHVDAGRIVVVAGDMNDDEGPAIGVRWVWQRGVDMIGVAVPHGVRVRASAESFATPSDHGRGVRAVLKFTY